MKRTILAILLASLIPMGAVAQVSVGPSLVRQQMVWRTNKTNSGLAAVFDSSVFQRSAAWSGSTVLTEYRDTTAAFSLMDAYIPNLKGAYFTQAHASVDSFFVARLSIHPTTSSTLGEVADSVFASFQFSFNGQDWAATAVPVIILLENGTANTFTRVINTNPVGTETNGGLTNSAFWPMPLVRLIILSDLNGEYEATLTYYTNRQSKL